LVPESLASKLEEAFTHDDTNWNLAPSCGGYLNDAFDDPNVKDTPQMYHALVYNNTPKSAITSLAMCILFFLESKIGLVPKEFSRVKANLLFPMFDSDTQYHPPHIDTDSDTSMSAVYYVNDSDGPTRFFDQNGNITHTVEPKRGRLVLFPSNTFHASSCPIHAKTRIVINFVFQP
jgi:hypothetical protein